MDFQKAAGDPGLQVKRWSFLTRLVFRFSAVYFLLYLPVNPIPGALVQPVATMVFARDLPLLMTGTGSGDRTFDWVRALCVLLLAIGATALWSVLDRNRMNYASVHQWLRLLIRLWLGYTMIRYGMMKVIPVQMPQPPLFQLLQPFGDFSPMGVLWSSIGASPAYERFIGSVELVGGMLLFLPRTVLLGALISLVATTQVFVLNMTYDVPAKLFSFHLILFTLGLLGPDARRLINVLIMNRGAGPSTQPLFGHTPARRRLAAAAQVAVGLSLTAWSFFNASAAWSRYGGGASAPPLHGIWNVDEMAIDGLARAPLVTDDERWRRVVFDRRGLIIIQRMDGRFIFHRGAVGTAGRFITLMSGPNAEAVGWFVFTQASSGELSLNGNLRGRRISARLRMVDSESFLLRNRGFHWVQEYPLNR